MIAKRGEGLVGAINIFGSRRPAIRLAGSEVLDEGGFAPDLLVFGGVISEEFIEMIRDDGAQNAGLLLGRLRLVNHRELHVQIIQ